MSRINDLKERLTLKVAANELKADSGEDVSESDVLQLALAGHLKLSIYFIERVKAFRQHITPQPIIPVSIVAPVANFIIPQTNEMMVDASKTVYLKGIYDLTMIGNEVTALEIKEWELLSDGREIVYPLFTKPGIFITSEDDYLYRISDESTFRLPRGSMLVVRPTNLKQFQLSLEPRHEVLIENLSTNEGAQQPTAIQHIVILNAQNRADAEQYVVTAKGHKTAEYEIITNLQRKFGMKGQELHDLIWPESRAKRSGPAKRKKLADTRSKAKM